MRDKYLSELMSLDEKLIFMANNVEKSIDLAMKALFNRDLQKAALVIDGDDQIDNLMKEIEEECVRLIAKEQPLASDLRFIYTVIKVSTDLERIGDHVVNIAEIVIKLADSVPLKSYIDLPLMAHIATEMVHSSIKSLIQRNQKLAKENCLRDNQVDGLNQKIRIDIVNTLKQSDNSDDIDKGINLVLLATNLERIADHATNIGERVMYLVSGQNIKY